MRPANAKTKTVDCYEDRMFHFPYINQIAPRLPPSPSTMPVKKSVSEYRDEISRTGAIIIRHQLHNHAMCGKRGRHCEHDLPEFFHKLKIHWHGSMPQELSKRKFPSWNNFLQTRFINKASSFFISINTCNDNSVRKPFFIFSISSVIRYHRAVSATGCLWFNDCESVRASFQLPHSLSLSAGCLDRRGKYF